MVRGRKIEHNKLYDFVMALVGRDTTIAGYLKVCEQLWNEPKHRPWISAALIRKAGILTAEPDEACIRFLGNKAYDALQLNKLKKPFSKKEFYEILPTIIQLMPEDVWKKSVYLWQTFINKLIEEYDISYPDNFKTKSYSLDKKTGELAALFVDAIDAKWTKSLDERLEKWKDEPEYKWLVALRRSRKFDELLDKVKTEVASRYKNP